MAAFGRLSGSDDRNDDPPARAESTSIIGRGTEIEGELSGRGQLRVEGRIEGTVRIEGEVQIADGGEVDGRIEADRVVAGGSVSGAIAARESVRLEEGCQVDADVFSPVLQLQEGGVMNGRVDMTGKGQPGGPPADSDGDAEDGGSGPEEPVGEEDTEDGGTDGDDDAEDAGSDGDGGQEAGTSGGRRRKRKPGGEGRSGG
jgi:cytoskeletal protein CcmA (bactofilin family)